MTFLEAAIELLRQAGRPLSIKDLTQRAIEQRLLTNEGRTPELTMQARLAQELRKGANTLLVKSDDDTFGLRRYDKPRLAAGDVAPEPAAPKAAREPKPAPAPDAAEPALAIVEAEVEAVEGDAADAAEAGEGGEPGEAGAKKKRRRRGGRGRGKKKDVVEGETEAVAAPVAVAPPVEAEVDDLVGDLEDVEDGTPEEAIAAERLAAEAERAEQAAAAEAARHVAEAGRRAEQARAAARREEARSAPVVEVADVALDDEDDDDDDENAPAPELFTPPGDDEPAVDLDAIMAPSRRRRGIIDLPDEAALAAEYGDELASDTTATAPVEGEIVDERTADEDRPMLDEIQADDRGRGRHRRGAKGKDRRGGKGRERERDRGRERGTGGAAGAAAERERPVAAVREPREPREHGPTNGATAPAAAASGADETAGAAPGGPRASLADVAYQLLRSINDGRPVHARQLAAMALKRRLLAGDPEDLWRVMRVALLDDARARQSRGLRPRVKHQGAGNFALVTTRLEPELAGLEEQLAARVESLARETRVALRRRLGKLALPALENLARVLLERLGYTEIERVKRVEATGYLSARVKHGALTQRVLVGVRSGADEAGRRAVGELRAGVAAKGMDAGLLLCVTRVGAEADREARAPGPPCTVYDGDAFAEALITANVGILRVALPVAYLDAEFFADLTEV